MVMAVPAVCQVESPQAPAVPSRSTSTPAATNAGGAVLHIGGGVKPPVVIYSVDPVFSDRARAAKFSGTVELYLWVDEDGNPEPVRVVRGVGMGLDEKAVEAIRQYKFKPATLDGKPVTVDLYIEVKFQMFRKDGSPY